MLRSILGRSLFLFIIVAISIQIQSTEIEDTKKNGHYGRLEENYRFKRATRRPGFFKTLFSVIFEQWNDTKQTYSKINNMINDNFLPENAPPIETTTNSNPNISTTTPAYKITRSEFNRILRRNLKGLVRLYNIELRDALKQSDRNYAEFRKNTSVEVSKFL